MLFCVYQKNGLWGKYAYEKVCTTHHWNPDTYLKLILIYGLQGVIPSVRRNAKCGFSNTATKLLLEFLGRVLFFHSWIL